VKLKCDASLTYYVFGFAFSIIARAALAALEELIFDK
jgi:hypothetical protein